MYVGTTFTPRILWLFGRRLLAYATAWGTAVTLAYVYLGWSWLAVPFLPISSVGVAVAFYVGFKNNAAFDRLWEARRIWGGIINTGRAFAGMATGIVTDATHRRALVRAYVAWAHMLRLQLRAPSSWNCGTRAQHLLVEVAEHHSNIPITPAEIVRDYRSGIVTPEIVQSGNMAVAILHNMMSYITMLKRERLIDDFEHSDLLRHIGAAFEHQGGAERIKNTPLARQYSLFSPLFVKLFIFLLPFGLVKQFADDGMVWATIPFMVLISWVFYVMELIGEASESPFDNGLNDVPISALCTTLTIDLGRMLGDTELPPPAEPMHDVLM